MEKIDKCDLLIVDDEPNFRWLLEGYFKRKFPGIKIKLAKDGVEAYNLALKFRPHIVWTCIRMPRMDGFELIKLIKENPDMRDAKVIVFSGYGSKEIKNRALEIGADAYFEKSGSNLDDILITIADMTALFKKKISALNAGKGMSQIFRGSNVSEIFNLLEVKGVKPESGTICEDTIHECREVLCGILWAVWVGIQKRGFRFPIPNLIIDGMLSMIEHPELYVDMLKTLPMRIAEYNEIMQKYLPDFSQAILIVADKFCENVRKNIDFMTKMNISLLLHVLINSVVSYMLKIEKDFQIVEKGD